jgi:hypothetical protein
VPAVCLGGGRRFVPATGGGEVAHGRDLTSSNTGVPAGTSLSDQSTSGGTIPPGAYVDKRFPDPSPDGWYTVGSDDTTFLRCEILGGLVIDTAHDVTLQQCDIQGGLSVSTSHRGLLEDCYLTDPGGDFMHLTGDSPANSSCDDWIIRRTLCEMDVASQGNVVEGAHLDGLQTRGVVNLTLEKSAWRMGAQWTHFGDPAPLNASVFFENANAGTSGLTVTDCYFDGGTSVFFMQPMTGTIVITGNRWGPLFSERVRNDNDVVPTVWSGNVIDADDTPLDY